MLNVSKEIIIQIAVSQLILYRSSTNALDRIVALKKFLDQINTNFIANKTKCSIEDFDMVGSVFENWVPSNW